MCRIADLFSNDIHVFLMHCSEDDDINDVATMGGVNLSEESRNILSVSTELIGAQVRSCRDEPFLDMSVLNERIQRIGECFEIP